jgi:hypothetical protein
VSVGSITLAHGNQDFVNTAMDRSSLKSSGVL